MAEIMFPSQITSAASRFRYVDSTGLVRGVYTGVAETTAYGGDRIAASIDIPPVNGANRAILMAWLASLKGKQNRAWLPDHTYVQRGSFPSSELLSNNTFANGAVGWTCGSQYSLTVSDGILRATRKAMTGTDNILISSSFSITQYAPYALRAMILPGRGAYTTGFSLNDSPFFGTISTGFGLKTQAFVPNVSTDLFDLEDWNTSGLLSGDYVLIPYTSFARCALADNAPNNTLWATALDNAAWTKSATTVSANAAAAPDGTTTADAITENGVNAAHYISQSGSRSNIAADLCAFGNFRRGAGTRNLFLTAGNDISANYGSAIFDLGAGTISNVTNTGTATNTRAFISPDGNGGYWCYIVSRAVAAATIAIAAQLANGTTISYAGDSTSTIAGWNVGIAVSSVPTRGGTTGASALSTGTVQSGNALYLKGLPASSNGLLLPGDWVQIGKQVVMVTASLNSDAAGLGYLQFSPPIRVSPADNDPVIVNQPMGKFIFTGQFPEWANEPGVLTRVSLDLEESCD